MNKYRRFYFSEECADEPEVILAKVEEMFEKMAKMPKGLYHVRNWPRIVRDKDFSSDKLRAFISGRMTLVAEEGKPAEAPVLYGFKSE